MWSCDWLPSPGITFSRFMLWHVFILHIFRLSSYIALYGYTMFSRSTHHLVDIWVISPSWLLWITLPWTFMYKFVWTFVFTSLGYIPRSGIAVSSGNSMFNILGNCQTVFQRGYTILHSHRRRIKFPISPHLCQHSLLPVFLIIAILVSLKVYLIVVFSFVFGFVACGVLVLWTVIVPGPAVEAPNPNHWIAREFPHCGVFFFFFFLAVPVALVATCGTVSGILNCGMQDLVSWSGIKPTAPALGAQSLIHWTTREVPLLGFCIAFP